MKYARYQEARFVTVLGGIKNAVLALLKIIFGVIGHSHALLADGVHSGSDLIIDGIVLAASRIGSKAADHDHPYGHARIETAAIVLVAVIIALAGLGIIYDASLEVFGSRHATQPSFYVIAIALFSVILNECLYHYTRKAGEKIHSSLLMTNAWHHRSDAVASLVVLMGTIGAWLGFTRLDPFAALVLGLMIIRMAWQFGWNSVRELVDTTDPATTETIKSVILSTAGVRAVHQLRTRLMGGNIFCDAHILVNPMISVSEGHFIGSQVHTDLMKKIPNMVDVTVHVDPEDDETTALAQQNLPSRSELVRRLKDLWKGYVPESAIDAITLHYLGEKIQLHLTLPFSFSSHKMLDVALAKAVDSLSFIQSITLSYTAHPDGLTTGRAV